MDTGYAQILGSFITLRLQWSTISRGRGRPTDNFTEAGRASWQTNHMRALVLSEAVLASSATFRTWSGAALGALVAGDRALIPVPGRSKRFGQSWSSSSHRTA